MRQRSVAICLTLLMTVVLAGCGGGAITSSGGETTTRTPPAGARSSRPATSTPPTSTVADLPRPGLFLIACEGGPIKLIDINPDTGHVAGQVEIPPDVPSGPFKDASLGNGCDRLRPSWQAREVFDPTFSRIAISQQFPDGTDRVGWYDVTTRSVVDVTARDIDNGFSGGTLHDSDPVFDPVTGDFWFERGDHTVSVDVHTMKETNEAPVSTGENLNPEMGVVNGHLVTTYGFVPDADGSRAAAVLPGDTGTILRVLDATHGVTDESAQGTDIAYPGPANVCVVEAWLDTSTVIVGGPDGAACPFTKVAVDSTAPKPEPILPSVTSDRLNGDFVAAPDGHAFALLTAAEDSYTVYESEGSPTADPTQLHRIKIAALFQAVLLCWC